MWYAAVVRYDFSLLSEGKHSSLSIKKSTMMRGRYFGLSNLIVITLLNTNFFLSAGIEGILYIEFYQWLAFILPESSLGDVSHSTTHMMVERLFQFSDRPSSFSAIENNL